MKRKVHKKNLTWIILQCIVITLFSSSLMADGLIKPTGLKLGVGVLNHTHYSSMISMLGIYFDKVQEIEDQGGHYSYYVVAKETYKNEEWEEECEGSCAYPFIELFHWMTDNEKNMDERHINEVTMAFTDQKEQLSTTLNTDITVKQIEDDTVFTAYYLGTSNPNPPSDPYYNPNDKIATFKIKGAPPEHSFECGGDGNGILGESDLNGTIELNDYYYNGKWQYDLGDMEVGDETYYLDIYDTTVTNDTTATLTITRYPVNIVFNSFSVDVQGDLTYTGTQLMPSITVKTSDEIPITLTENIDYSVSFEKDGTTISESEVKNAGEYTVVITGKEGTSYEGKVATKTFIIKKGTPDSPTSIPTGLTAMYGQTIGEIPLPQEFTWQDEEDTLVGNLGTNTFKAIYNPDTENYNGISGIEIPIEVGKANQEQLVLELSSPIAILGLTPPELNLNGGGGTGTLHYVSSNPSIATVNQTTGEITIIGAGTTEFTVTKDADTNYNASEESNKVTLNVKNKTELTVKDTAATEVAIINQLKNQGKIDVKAPVRDGLTNDFSIEVTGKSSLTNYTNINAEQGEAKWIGLLIGNFQVNHAMPCVMTDLYYKTSESAVYSKWTDRDKSESLRVGGTDKEFILWMKSDRESMKNIWIATSPEGLNETKVTIHFTAYNSHSGGSHSSSKNTSVEKLKPSIPLTETKTVKGITTVSASMKVDADKKGKASIVVPKETVADLIKNVKNAETKDKKAMIKIDLETSNHVKEVEIKLEKEAFGEMIKETNVEMLVETEIGSITFDEKALTTIEKQGNGDIDIYMKAVDSASLSDELKVKVGNHPIYEMNISSGNKKVHSFEGGAATIRLPYMLQSDEDKNAVVVYYIEDSGELQIVKGIYNDQTKSVDFVANHFSKYAVGYNKTEYIDIDTNAWYKDAVTFLSAREIVKGTSEVTFSPNKAITRGEFLVMLMRAYDIEPKENNVINFEDAGNTYYTAYLATAKEMDITQGIGNNLYQPNAQISRQDMITMLYRALNVLGEIPTNDSKEMMELEDFQTVASYAKVPVEALTSTGIISGSNGKLNPTGKTTRAEMTQVLYNLLAK